MIPPAQLQRFAGARKIHYALGTYGSPRGGDARFSIAPHALYAIPSLQVSPGFTGRSLDRSRLGYVEPASSTYGAADGRQLRWGGDEALEAERSRSLDDEDEDAPNADRYGAVTSTEEFSLDDYANDGAVTHDAPSSGAPTQALENDGDYEADASIPANADANVYGRCAPARLRAARRNVYQEEDREEPLAVGPAGVALTSSTPDAKPLEITDKIRLLQLVAGRVAPDGYATVAAPDEADASSSLGLCWGFVLFPQKTGAIGRVLELALSRERSAPVPRTVGSIFGPSFAAVRERLDAAGKLSPEARLDAVDGKRLWEEPWLGAFREAGRLPHVQASQNELAVGEVFDGMLPIARAFGITSPRGLAVLLDRAMDMGVGGARSWVMAVAGPIRTQADRDTALRAVGYHAGDLRGFQSGSGLLVDGRWGPLTHAALTRALRQIGAETPIRVATESEVLASLERESHAEAFADRVRGLLTSADLDDATSYAIE